MPSDKRKPIISGNWKMNLNHFEAIQTVQKLHYSLPKDIHEAVDVSVHPPFTDVRSVQTVIEACGRAGLHKVAVVGTLPLPERDTAGDARATRVR